MGRWYNDDAILLFTPGGYVVHNGRQGLTLLEAVKSSGDTVETRLVISDSKDSDLAGTWRLDVVWIDGRKHHGTLTYPDGRGVELKYAADLFPGSSSLASDLAATSLAGRWQAVSEIPDGFPEVFELMAPDLYVAVMRTRGTRELMADRFEINRDQCRFAERSYQTKLSEDKLELTQVGRDGPVGPEVEYRRVKPPG
ncbi:MAG: hypothetical protein AB7S38_31840 [Vulcanimicrobiota bacterium]